MAQPFDLDRLALTGEPRPVAEQVELNGPASAAFTVSDAGVLAYQPAAARGSQLVWLDREGRQLGTVGDAGAIRRPRVVAGRRGRPRSACSTRSTNTRDLWVFDVARGVRTRFTFDRGDEVAADLVGGRHARVLHVEPQRTLRPVSEDRERRRDRRAGVRGRRRQVPDQPVAGRPVAAVLGVRRRRRQALSVLPLTRRAQADAVFLGIAGGSRPAVAERPLASPTRPPSPGVPKSTSCRFPVASRKWQVSSAGGNLPRWRRDGKEIFYAASDNRLMAVTVDDDGPALEVGPARPLFEARPVGPRSFFDVSADGQRFLVNSLRSESLSSSITIAPELERRAEAVTSATGPRLAVHDLLGRRVVPLDKPVFTIGRRDGHDLQLAGTEVSRDHAEIVSTAGGIRDPRSRLPLRHVRQPRAGDRAAAGPRRSDRVRAQRRVADVPARRRPPPSTTACRRRPSAISGRSPRCSRACARWAASASSTKCSRSCSTRRSTPPARSAASSCSPTSAARWS